MNFEDPNIVTDHWIKSNSQNGLQLSQWIVGLDTFFFFLINGIGLDFFVLIVLVQSVLVGMVYSKASLIVGIL